jgi:hypothetical protein
MSDERYEINEPAVVADEIDGMAVIINLESGAYYSGTESSAEAWVALIAGADAGELAAAMAVPTTALAAFIGHLLEQGLLRPRNADPRKWSAGPARGQLALERFDDLEDLLLLDPVHDVTQQGWPHRDG